MPKGPQNWPKSKLSSCRSDCKTWRPRSFFFWYLRVTSSGSAAVVIGQRLQRDTDIVGLVCIYCINIYI